MQYIYLHGLFSGPGSSKGLKFKALFAEKGLSLEIPDLNGPDFSGMTIHSQLKIALELFQAEEITLIGSSLGGFLAAHLAERDERVKKLVLLAPAFEFIQRWMKELGEEAIANWKREGQRRFFHYGFEKDVPWSSAIIEDCKNYTGPFQRTLPALIMHGLYDAVVPYDVSVNYLYGNQKARLILMHSDHQLHDVLDQILLETIQFCLID